MPHSTVHPAARLQKLQIRASAEFATAQGSLETLGSCKSGGARVIYFNLTEQEVVLLVAVYAKADRANMLAAEIKKVV